MARVTLGTPPDTREEKTTDELRQIIADALNKADNSRNLNPADIALLAQENSDWGGSYGIKEAAGPRSMTQQMADERVISEIAKKYKTRLA